MFIKEVTLYGFKSFAEKTKIVFNPGITAIVGPNGAGKSNIVDSISWVLGEQSPKSLRGVSMEDVIYLGSFVRSPLNITTVRLVLNNEDNTLPLDFQEVSIQRQASKDENNLYLLNDVPCRLIDIKSLIASAGLGKQFKSIINQGELDNVLTSHPKEKKHLIEDACGVTKYEIRKKKAFRKLKKTDVNIFRLKDIVSEVNRQLKPLKKQAEVAQRFSELEKQLREKELSLTVTVLLDLKNTEEGIIEKEEIIKAEIDNLKTDLNQLESTKNEIAEKIRDLSDKLQNDFDNLYIIEKNTVTIKGWKSLVSEKSKYLKSMIKGWQDLSIALSRGKVTDELDINVLKSKLEDIEDKIKSKKEKQREKNAHLYEIREKIAQKNIIYDKQEDGLQSLLLKLSTKTSDSLPLLSRNLNLLKENIDEMILKIREYKSIFSEPIDVLNKNKDAISNISFKNKKIEEIINYSESKLINIKSELKNNQEISKKYESILSLLEKGFSDIKEIPQQINKLINGEKDILSELKSIEVSISVLEERKSNLEVKLNSLRKKDIIIKSDKAYRKKALEEAKNVRKKANYLEDIFIRMENISRHIAKILKEINRGDRSELENHEIKREEISKMVRYKKEKIEKLREEYQILNLNKAQLKVNIQSKTNELRRLGYESIDKAVKKSTKILDIEKIQKEINNFKAGLYEIGPINPIALEDYQKLNDRRKFLNEQIKDLTNAKRDLLKLLSEVDKQMENLFLESFEKVDIYFRELFKTLFPKGDAHLELIKIENKEETGVDIKVNVGGIKNRAISLLSGGEKALVSIAFIFALFKLMPSPFYILDEVDAALDEVNLKRFINLVEKFKKEHQLIIITHQRRTMEMADVLYGVSMNPDGTSKIVSERIA